MKLGHWRSLVLPTVLALAACSNGPKRTIRMNTPAFAPRSAIPATYTCGADNHAPPLTWDGVPAGAKSLVLLVDDEDANHYTHWLVYNIPPTTTGSPEAGVPDGGVEGKNDAGTVGYSGPCPPPGKPHRYVFHVYALDVQPNLPPGADRAAVDKAMDGHQLAQGEIVGNFAR